MAHYTKKKTSGRKKLTKAKAKVVRSKKRVQRKRTTLKNNAKGGVGNGRQSHMSRRGANQAANERRRQAREYRQQLLQPIKDKLSEIKKLIETNAIKSKYKALRFKNDVGEDLRNKYFGFLDYFKKADAELNVEDNTEGETISDDDIKRESEERNRQTDVISGKLNDALDELTSEVVSHETDRDAEVLSDEDMQKIMSQRQAKSIFTITDNANESIVITTPVDVLVNSVKVRIVGETSIMDGEGLVNPKIAPIALGYEIGSATTDDISMQLLKIIDAAIHNYDVRNGNSGENVPIPNLKDDKYTSGIEYTPVFIFRRVDGVVWEIRLVQSNQVALFQKQTNEDPKNAFKGIMRKQYAVTFEDGNFTFQDMIDSTEWEVPGTIEQ
jgi:hypothetical protein